MYLMDSADVERELLRLPQFRKLYYEVAGSLAQLKLPCGSSMDFARGLDGGQLARVCHETRSTSARARYGKSGTKRVWWMKKRICLRCIGTSNLTRYVRGGWSIRQSIDGRATATMRRACKAD
jgi:hypothetical protein